MEQKTIEKVVSLYCEHLEIKRKYDSLKKLVEETNEQIEKDKRKFGITNDKN